MNAPLTIEQLKADHLILLECISGSRAYGLATPQSDTDIKGVFYLPNQGFMGCKASMYRKSVTLAMTLSITS